MASTPYYQSPLAGDQGPVVAGGARGV